MFLKYDDSKESQDTYIHSRLKFGIYLDPKLENLSDMEIIDVGISFKI